MEENDILLTVKIYTEKNCDIMNLIINHSMKWYNLTKCDTQLINIVNLL